MNNEHENVDNHNDNEQPVKRKPGRPPMSAEIRALREKQKKELAEARAQQRAQKKEVKEDKEFSLRRETVTLSEEETTVLQSVLALPLASVLRIASAANNAADFLRGKSARENKKHYAMDQRVRFLYHSDPRVIGLSGRIVGLKNLKVIVQDKSGKEHSVYTTDIVAIPE
jgi:hypothetical protein